MQSTVGRSAGSGILQQLLWATGGMRGPCMRGLLKHWRCRQRWNRLLVNSSSNEQHASPCSEHDLSSTLESPLKVHACRRDDRTCKHLAYPGAKDFLPVPSAPCKLGPAWSRMGSLSSQTYERPVLSRRTRIAFWSFLGCHPEGFQSQKA